MARGNFQWDEAAGVAQSAHRRLPGLAEAYFRQGRKLTGAPASPQALHRFRLQTKRLRYTLELFRACYGPGLDTRLAGLRQIQQYLGEINDCAVTGQLLAGQLPPNAPLRARMERFLRARAIQKICQFNRFWREVFDRSGEAERAVNYLARRTSVGRLLRPRGAPARPAR